MSDSNENNAQQGSNARTNPGASSTVSTRAERALRRSQPDPAPAPRMDAPKTVAKRRRAPRRERGDPENEQPASKAKRPITMDDLLEDVSLRERENPMPRMKYEELVKKLDSRSSDWSQEDEQSSVEALEANPELLEAMEWRDTGMSATILRLWKACIFALDESPDFIVSGHIGLADRGAFQAGLLQDNLPYPLVVHPIWKRSVPRLRFALALVATCRAQMDNFQFPWSWSERKTVVDFIKSHNTTLHIAEIIKKAARDPDISEGTYFELLLTIAKRFKKVSNGQRREWEPHLMWVIDYEDIRELLSAIDSVNTNNIRTLLPTDIALELANKARSQRDIPSQGQLEELRRKSVLRQMYLTIQCDYRYQRNIYGDTSLFQEIVEDESPAPLSPDVASEHSVPDESELDKGPNNKSPVPEEEEVVDDDENRVSSPKTQNPVPEDEDEDDDDPVTTPKTPSPVPEEEDDDDDDGHVFFPDDIISPVRSEPDLPATLGVVSQPLNTADSEPEEKPLPRESSEPAAVQAPSPTTAPTQESPTPQAKEPALPQTQPTSFTLGVAKELPGPQGGVEIHPRLRDFPRNHERDESLFTEAWDLLRFRRRQ
ncbi:hypothetical protein B0T11DRAFT_329596 [Plectosphaerella cucumerina]|uniref:Uncharacterized protein n=1 Tax=Plectosphaerella cucumerina TaxID=40658 RepID=A0A8K0X0I6_9PEZI|nr:hypothetical protein B0T11DRAFT_329596 [Plectosphaerella cucumerina]